MPEDQVVDQPKLRLEWVDPKSLTPNPKNWRRHPKAQREALSSVLGQVGWAGALLYNEITNRLIDGHLRQEVVPEGELVPVLIGSWTPEQEALILATLDPLAAMAESDASKVQALLDGLGEQDAAVQAVLDSLAAEANAGEAPEFPEYDESIANGVSICICPTCGHEHAKKD